MYDLLFWLIVLSLFIVSCAFVYVVFDTRNYDRPISFLSFIVAGVSLTLVVTFILFRGSARVFEEDFTTGYLDTGTIYHTLSSMLVFKEGEEPKYYAFLSKSGSDTILSYWFTIEPPECFMRLADDEKMFLAVSCE